VVESDGRQAARMIAGINGEQRLVVNEVSGIGTEQTLVRAFPGEYFLMIPGKRFEGRLRLGLARLGEEVLHRLEPSPRRPDLQLVRTSSDGYRLRLVGPIHMQSGVLSSRNLVDWQPATNAFNVDGESIEVRISSSGGEGVEFYKAAP
jgi:hypothetical protein